MFDLILSGGGWDSSVGGLLARRLDLQCVQAGIGRRVRVQLEYRAADRVPEHRSSSRWGSCTASLAVAAAHRAASAAKCAADDYPSPPCLT